MLKQKAMVVLMLLIGVCLLLNWPTTCEARKTSTEFSPMKVSHSQQLNTTFFRPILSTHLSRVHLRLPERHLQGKEEGKLLLVVVTNCCSLVFEEQSGADDQGAQLARVVCKQDLPGCTS